MNKTNVLINDFLRLFTIKYDQVSQYIFNVEMYVPGSLLGV